MNVRSTVNGVGMGVERYELWILVCGVPPDRVRIWGDPTK